MSARDFKGATDLVAHTLKGEGFDASEDGTGRGTPIVPVAFAIQERAVSENPNAGPDGMGVKGDGSAYTLEARQQQQAVAFDLVQITSAVNRSIPRPVCPTMSKASDLHAIMPWAVRRLTPEECEALQGFPRGYTDIPWRKKPTSPDGPRYKALGNSWATNCAEWIGERMTEVDAWTLQQ